MGNTETFEELTERVKHHFKNMDDIIDKMTKESLTFCPTCGKTLKNNKHCKECHEKQ